MSGFSNLMKNGWHPDKNDGFKKQVTGIWKKDDSAYEARASHTSRPLSSLRDPASFGPPPRHVALGGEPSAGGSSTAVSTYSGSHAGSHTTTSSHAPLTSARPSLPSRSRATSSAAEEEEEPREPQPYRMDTTGLNTSHLPPPPTRRDGTGVSRSPVPPPSGPTKRPTAIPPGLPPRLPPRSTPSPNPPAGASTSTASAHPPPPPRPAANARVSPATTGNAGHAGNTAGESYINQDAVNRLGRAGISVPGLGIGGGSAGGGAAHGGQAQQPTALAAINSLAAASSASVQESQQTVNHAPPASQFGELQARFAKMGSGGSGVGGAGANRTPSRSPARLPVESINRSSAAVSGSSTPSLSAGAAANIAAGKKKPPPPPPAKKPGLAAAAAKAHTTGMDHRPNDEDDDGPPPIPMATRPQGW